MTHFYYAVILMLWLFLMMQMDMYSQQSSDILSKFDSMLLKPDKAMMLPDQPKACREFVNDAGVQLSSRDGGLSHFTITSPNYPAHYYNNTDCFRVLMAPEIGDRLSITWEQFNVEVAPSCSSDFIEIRDGPFGFSPLLGRLCDNYKHKVKTITSKGRYLWLWFHSDATLSKTGFLGRAVIIKPTNVSPTPKDNKPLLDDVCVAAFLLQDDEMVLPREKLLNHLSTTQRMTGLHGEAIDCSLLVNVPSKLQIFFHLENLRFPSKNEQCQKTKIEFYDGFTRPLSNTTLCSKITERHLLTNTSRAVLRIVSEEVTSLVNFTAVISLIAKGPCDTRVYNCGNEEYCLSRRLLCNHHVNCPNGVDEMCENGIHIGYRNLTQLTVTSAQPIAVSTEPTDKAKGLNYHYVILAAIACVFSLLTCICCVITIRQKRVEERVRRIPPMEVAAISTGPSTIVDNNKKIKASDSAFSRRELQSSTQLQQQQPPPSSITIASVPAGAGGGVGVAPAINYAHQYAALTQIDQSDYHGNRSVWSPMTTPNILPPTTDSNTTVQSRRSHSPKISHKVGGGSQRDIGGVANGVTAPASATNRGTTNISSQSRSNQPTIAASISNVTPLPTSAQQQHQQQQQSMSQQPIHAGSTSSYSKLILPDTQADDTMESMELQSRIGRYLAVQNPVIPQVNVHPRHNNSPPPPSSSLQHEEDLLRPPPPLPLQSLKPMRSLNKQKFSFDQDRASTLATITATATTSSSVHGRGRLKETSLDNYMSSGRPILHDPIIAAHPITSLKIKRAKSCASNITQEERYFDIPMATTTNPINNPTSSRSHHNWYSKQLPIINHPHSNVVSASINHPSRVMMGKPSSGSARSSQEVLSTTMSFVPRGYNNSQREGYRDSSTCPTRTYRDLNSASLPNFNENAFYFASDCNISSPDDENDDDSMDETTSSGGVNTCANAMLSTNERRRPPTVISLRGYQHSIDSARQPSQRHRVYEFDA